MLAPKGYLKKFCAILSDPSIHMVYVGFEIPHLTVGWFGIRRHNQSVAIGLGPRLLINS